MVDEEFQRGMIGEVGLKLVPEAVRQSMLADSGFLKNFDLSMTIDGTINFYDGPEFTSSLLFTAIRETEETGEPVLLRDKRDQQWSVAIANGVNGRKSPQLTQDGKTFDCLDGSLVLSDEKARKHVFDNMANAVAWPKKDRQHWNAIISKRPLTDNEVLALHEDLENSPIRFVGRLSKGVRAGETSIDLLIPENRRYYERLVGEIGIATTVHEHARCGAAINAEHLVAWDEKGGLLLALLTGAHSDFPSVIPLKDMNTGTVIEVFNLLADKGDMISRLGAVQVALPLLAESPELVEPIEKLLDSILKEDPSTEVNGFLDLSRLFIFVDSEISRRGVLRGVPPFYRRLASFAQASLIQRQLLAEGVDQTEFRKWIKNSFGAQFYSQSLADMRIAPRWSPELIHADQLKQEFIGRLLGSVEAVKDKLGEGRLFEFLSPTSEHEHSLKVLSELLKPYFSGPLEGNTSPSQHIPEEMLAVIYKQLAEPELSTKSFIAAVNFANVFMVEDDLASRISELLQKGRYQLHSVVDERELAAVLLGLAQIAAATRSSDLAKDVRVLVRKYRNDPNLQISISEAYQTLFFAAAAHAELNDWCIFVGESLKNLAFSTLTKDDANELGVLIQHMCVAEPELWTTIGAANAALSAFVAS